MDTKTKNKKELKIIVVGNSGTGKTSFVNKWIKNTFSENYKATIVSEFSYKIYEYKGKMYKIQLWDLAGQDQNTCITKIFAKDSHGTIVLSDITNEQTLQESIKWKDSVDENTKFLDGDLLPSVLVRNKIDLLENDVQDDEEIKEFAEQHRFVNVFKTSAKMGIGIDECMEFIIGNIIDRLDKLAQEGKLPVEKERSSIILQSAKAANKPEEQSGGMCC